MTCAYVKGNRAASKNNLHIPKPGLGASLSVPSFSLDGTNNVFLTTIHGLAHVLMQLVKTSERKMVMYNIASNLNGIFSGC